LSKYFKAGIGYFSLKGIEVIREKITLTVSNQEFQMIRNYNFTGNGPKFFVNFIIPVLKWLNFGVKTEFIPLFSNSILQDITDFPVYVPVGEKNTLLTKRILINSWTIEENRIPLLFNIILNLDLLISRRMSFSVNAGYTVSNDYIPEVYEAGGNRQWSEDIDQNCTFIEYQNFNFSKQKINGDRVKLNFTGINIAIGFAVHF